MNKDILSESVVNRDQLQHMVSLLLSHRESAGDDIESPAAVPKKPSTVVFGPSGSNSSNSSSSNIDDSRSESMRASVSDDIIDVFDGDFNKAPDEVVALAKERMSVDFEKNRLKPGDPGYEWDVAIDFEPPLEACDWDD